MVLGFAVVVLLLIYLILRLEKFMATASQALTDLQNQVAAEQTVEQSAITLITNLAGQVAAANGVSPAAVEAVVAQIQNNAAALAAAVAANTPAASSAPSSNVKSAS